MSNEEFYVCLADQNIIDFCKEISMLLYNENHYTIRKIIEHLDHVNPVFNWEDNQVIFSGFDYIDVICGCEKQIPYLQFFRPTEDEINFKIQFVGENRIISGVGEQFLPQNIRDFI